MLNTLRIERVVSTAAWRRLHRPLRLPRTLAPGAACLRAVSARAAPSVYFTLGPGPAYPVLGTRNGIAVLADHERRDGVYWHKTLWAISPRYRGPLLIRGEGVRGRTLLLFSSGGGPPRRELQLTPAIGQAIWRYAPTATIIPGSGCYAFQIDGTTFSRTVVFSAMRAG